MVRRAASNVYAKDTNSVFHGAARKPVSVSGVTEFLYSDILPTTESAVPYRKITEEYVSTFEAGGLKF